MSVKCRGQEEAEEIMKLLPAVKRILSESEGVNDSAKIVKMLAGSGEMRQVRIPTEFFYAVLFSRNCKPCIYLTW